MLVLPKFFSPGLDKASEIDTGLASFLHVRPLCLPQTSWNAVMGILMIDCPETGRAISTGRHVETAIFGSTPVFFSRTYCPLCRAMHEWFAKDARVCDSEYLESETASAQQVA